MIYRKTANVSVLTGVHIRYGVWVVKPQTYTIQLLVRFYMLTFDLGYAVPGYHRS